jgi:hypothetical protein
LLDQLPFALAHGVAGMARGAAIDGSPSGPGVLGHMRRDANPTHGLDPGAPVEQLVRGHGDAAPCQRQLAEPNGQLFELVREPSPDAARRLAVIHAGPRIHLSERVHGIGSSAGCK